MKILHITPGVDERTGGPAYVALGLCQALARKGLDITLFTTNIDCNGPSGVPLGQAITHNGVKLHFFPVSYPRSYVYSPQLGRALSRTCSDFDLVHIHGTWCYPQAVGCYIARKNHVPYIVRPRANLRRFALQKNRLRKSIYALLIERRNLNHAAAIQFYGSEEMEDARQFGVRSRPIFVPNGVEPVADDRLAALKGRFRSRYPDLVDKRIVLFLGRIAAIKGLDRLVWAFRDVVQVCPDCRLVLAGPDNEGFSTQVRRWLRQAGLSEHATFTGHLSGDDKTSALVDADVFCMSSYQEGHSCALKEALMCGLPAVVTQEIGLNDLVECSVVIRTNSNPADLAKGLLTILTDATLRRQMGQRARELILSKYTWDKVAEELITDYEQIVGSTSLRK
jgi:glycosyltransferase involved in cell wall biosynthesis